MSSVSRRDFLKLVNKALGALGLAAVGGPVAAFFYPSDTSEQPADPVLVGPVAGLPPEGATVKFGRYPALVINTREGVRAYSAVCTHFACLVKFDPAIGQIMCPCHEAFFDPVDGSVISGPPPRALDKVPVSVEGGQIYIGGGA